MSETFPYDLVNFIMKNLIFYIKTDTKTSKQV